MQEAPLAPATGRVGFFGGSFDPPHVGHLLVMAWALGCARPRFDRLLMVPCYSHAFEKQLVGFEHRLEMCHLVARELGGRVEVSDVERRLGGPSQTLRTVRALLEERPEERIVVVMGSDLLAERERWYHYPELAELVDFMVVGRAGHAPGAAREAFELSIPDVSSTEIRQRVRAREGLEGLVPTAVADYVAAHRLYQEDGSPSGGGG